MTKRRPRGEYDELTRWNLANATAREEYRRAPITTPPYCEKCKRTLRLEAVLCPVCLEKEGDT